ncbi:patatin-like phospholipase family protein [Hoeflea sp. YIM 152468]|uniref:patatin-like phospholipase family protein n=1 Tax=Hoeflea sp. YIM 152468 TaxID=3031759 RepID=UPI0023D9EBDB|nr:patatin-like phospholipase family protein [Hoeflea sp. YIM 152468]MDF1606643.1 patatin-like phospholipase family protein [Hoeflea sp. YIM 152468]
MSSKEQRPTAKTKGSSLSTINLALQGGGSHGAFAWGVIDRLLDEPDIEFEGLSGTSAGAVNAVVLAHGLMNGGHKGGQAALEDFWHKSSRSGSGWSPFGPMPKSGLPGMDMFAAATHAMLDTMTRTFSPYDLNPFNINPLHDLLADSVDFEGLRAHSATKLFVSATNVRSGRVRVFQGSEVSADAVMASACLPFLFKAVEIDGEHYWDGGYMGNPVLYPFFYQCESRDVMIVHVNPMERQDVPMTAPDIMNRINEISFNSSLVDEMRAINFVTRMIEQDWLKDEHRNRLRQILIHSVRADAAMEGLPVSSKFDVSWPFLTDLRDRGRSAADTWLKINRDDLGKKSTVNLEGQFLRMHSSTPVDPLVVSD